MSPEPPPRAGNSRRLTVLSPAERLALYGVPDFDEFQRAQYFALTGPERALAEQRKGFAAQLHCMVQIGYFKAKNAFFRLAADAVPAEDVAFLLERYFPGRPAAFRAVAAHEQYAQRTAIAKLFGYRLWSATDQPSLAEAAALVARRDVTPSFVLIELLAFLNARKIVRPGHTTLQTIIGDALTAERARLERLIDGGLDGDTRVALRNLLVREEALSELAVLKQDAKNFGHRMMAVERQKRARLAPIHQAAKRLLPRLGISQQNVEYYASLVHFYTIYDLRRMRPAQSHLCLLCHAWQRYRQLSDNLLEAFDRHLKQVHQQTKEASEEAYIQAQAKRQQEAPRVGRVLLLYVDEAVGDATPFGDVRRQAFAILPREALLSAGERLCEKPVSQLDLRWQAVGRAAARFKHNPRPLVAALDFSAEPASSQWRAALCWMRDVFARGQRLSNRPVTEIPQGTIPKRLRHHLLNFDSVGNPHGLRGDRYEFWLYRQLGKRLASGELAVDDSLRHRRFGDELVEPSRQAGVLKSLNVPWLSRPVEAVLDSVCADLDRRWPIFDRELRQGRLKHLAYDPQRKTLSARRPKAARNEETLQDAFYGKLAAAIIARAIGHGNLRMAETCDIPYHVLEATGRQHIRLATLRDACDRISNFIAALPIFPLCSFDPEILYGSVDGQKLAAAESPPRRPTSTGSSPRSG